ncbi:unnamed protein product [Amoebophrya sp. A120]|nr:unnamed protein product [Amoebophrya sp. A120]|eukprot:GSA120T00011144001.1
MSLAEGNLSRSNNLGGGESLRRPPVSRTADGEEKQKADFEEQKLHQSHTTTAATSSTGAAWYEQSAYQLVGCDVINGQKKAAVSLLLQEERYDGGGPPAAIFEETSGRPVLGLPERLLQVVGTNAHPSSSSDLKLWKNGVRRIVKSSAGVGASSFPHNNSPSVFNNYGIFNIGANTSNSSPTAALNESVSTTYSLLGTGNAVSPASSAGGGAGAGVCDTFYCALQLQREEETAEFVCLAQVVPAGLEFQYWDSQFGTQTAEACRDQLLAFIAQEQTTSTSSSSHPATTVQLPLPKRLRDQLRSHLGSSPSPCRRRRSTLEHHGGSTSDWSVTKIVRLHEDVLPTVKTLLVDYDTGHLTEHTARRALANPWLLHEFARQEWAGAVLRTPTRSSADAGAHGSRSAQFLPVLTIGYGRRLRASQVLSDTVGTTGSETTATGTASIVEHQQRTLEVPSWGVISSETEIRLQLAPQPDLRILRATLDLYSDDKPLSEEDDGGKSDELDVVSKRTNKPADQNSPQWSQGGVLDAPKLHSSEPPMEQRDDAQSTRQGLLQEKSASPGPVVSRSAASSLSIAECVWTADYYSSNTNSPNDAREVIDDVFLRTTPHAAAPPDSEIDATPGIMTENSRKRRTNKYVIFPKVVPENHDGATSFPASSQLRILVYGLDPSLFLAEPTRTASDLLFQHDQSVRNIPFEHLFTQSPQSLADIILAEKDVHLPLPATGRVSSHFLDPVSQSLRGVGLFLRKKLAFERSSQSQSRCGPSSPVGSTGPATTRSPTADRQQLHPRVDVNIITLRVTCGWQNDLEDFVTQLTEDLGFPVSCLSVFLVRRRLRSTASADDENEAHDKASDHRIMLPLPLAMQLELQRRGDLLNRRTNSDSDDKATCTRRPDSSLGGSKPVNSLQPLEKKMNAASTTNLPSTEEPTATTTSTSSTIAPLTKTVLSQLSMSKQQAQTSHVILSGPTGSGKTMVVRNARHMSVVSIPDIVKSGVGESARAVRQQFVNLVRVAEHINARSGSAVSSSSSTSFTARARSVQIPSSSPMLVFEDADRLLGGGDKDLWARDVIPEIARCLETFPALPVLFTCRDFFLVPECIRNKCRHVEALGRKASADGGIGIKKTILDLGVYGMKDHEDNVDAKKALLREKELRKEEWKQAVKKDSENNKRGPAGGEGPDIRIDKKNYPEQVLRPKARRETEALLRDVYRTVQKEMDNTEIDRWTRVSQRLFAA